MNSTPSYTVPTLPPSLTLPSSALPALFVDMTSAPGPHTPHSNKLLFSLGPAPLNSSANTTKHGLTLPPLHAHNSSTHSNLTFPNTNPQPLPGPYRPSSPSLPAPPLMIHSARCVKVPLTRKKCFSVTYVTPVGIWKASPPPHHHPCWDMEMSLVHPSCPLITGCTRTPPLPLPHPGRAATEGFSPMPPRARWIGPESHEFGQGRAFKVATGVCIGKENVRPRTNDYKPMHTPLYIGGTLVRSSGRAAASG